MGWPDESVHAKIDPGVQHQSHGPAICRAILPPGRGAWEKACRRELESAVDLSNAKISLRSKWPGVSVVAVQSSGNGHYKVGDAMNVDAMLDLPGIDPALVQVQSVLRADQCIG